MKIIFMGTPEFALPSLEALNEKYEVVLVVSQPAKPEGRKGILRNPPVIEKAIELGLKTYQPACIKDSYDYFLNVEADMIVTAAYGQFIPTKILKLYKKAINVHGSLLPLHRGGAPIQRSIMEGDKETGVTIMEMVKKMDAGRMYAKCSIPILEEDNNTSIFSKLSVLGAKLLIDNIEDIYNGVNLGIEQDESLATISPNISKEEEKIDFGASAIDVFNQIRGLSLNPGAYGLFNDSRIKIYKASVIKDNSQNEPGTIIEISKNMVIKCGKDAIKVEVLQVPGKKQINIKDFLNGQKMFKVNDHFQ